LRNTLDERVNFRIIAVMGIFTDQLLAVASAYCEATGVSLSTAGGRAFAESKLLVNLAAGVSSPTFARADRAVAWFSLHWPDGADWPPAVPRPSVDPEAAA
jgi:hypothetical protein